MASYQMKDNGILIDEFLNLKPGAKVKLHLIAGPIHCKVGEHQIYGKRTIFELTKGLCKGDLRGFQWEELGLLPDSNMKWSCNWVEVL